MTKYIVANWKANKTEKETIDWFKEMTTFDFSTLKEIEIVTCLPYVFLPVAKEEIKNNQLPIKLGAQNVSHFEEGPYTGVVTAGMLKDLVNYVLVGHSERRKILGETDDLIFQKIVLSLKYNITPIICVSNLEQVEFLKKKLSNFSGKENIIFLYEPLKAIGSGQAEEIEVTVKVIQKMKKIIGELPFLYGGSVSGENVLSYLSDPQIDGVAVGGASLDPNSFLEILKNAAKI